jgi:ABC-type sugar transport system ATPase subunit
MVAIEIEGVDLYFRVRNDRRRPVDLPSQSDRIEDEEGQSTVVEDGLIHALDSVDLSIRNGETLAILGPSGCGKSSLLRVVAGLAEPRRGGVYFDGVEVTDTAPGDRNVGVVFQDYALYPHMESKRNLSFFFTVNQRADESEDRVRDVCEIMGEGFEDLLDRKPRKLSGGEQQRVAVGRCIIRDPSVFLLDEPLSNLDARLRATLRLQLKRLLQHFGITAIYVTHDQSEAVALADRIALMQSGQISQVGTYRELYDRPHNTFVAGFLGEPPMNLLPGRVHQGNVQVGGWDLSSTESKLRILEGENITLGIRPEHVIVGEDNRISASWLEVETVQRLVSEREQLTTFRVGQSRLIARHKPNAKVRNGSKVAVCFSASNMYVFDRRGMRVI